MIKEAIRILAAKKDLAPDEMRRVLEQIFSGVVETADIVAFLSSLNDKGETVEELTAAVNVMLKYVDPIIVDRPDILDTCGTGGDKKGTFNISTLSAFVASGAGVTVAKHGNRSVSSNCGSADLLEALGVNINMDKDRIRECLERIGIAFLFAPNLHPVMKHVMPARKQMAKKTIFNILGPLINPARATNQLVGVYSREWTGILARVLSNLGSRHVLVVHGSDGLDEVTTTDKTYISEARGGDFRDYEVAPEGFGFKRANLTDLIGGSLERNKQIALDVLSAKPGPQRDIVLFNSGCAIYAADKAGSIEEGISLARESIDAGRAEEKLELLKKFSQG